MSFPGIEKWQILLKTDARTLNAASSQLHYASQFIAILGKYLLEEKSDDSHTTAEWLPDHDLMAGNWIKGKKLFRLGIDFENFELILLNNEIEITDSIELDGKNQNEIFDWIKTKVSELGKHSEELQLEIPYDIPKNNIAKGEPFIKPAQNILDELLKLRHNSQLIFGFITSKFKGSYPIKIWPHHFDTGSIIPVKKDENDNLLKSISLGLAIPDDVVNEHYFYVSPWSKKDNISYESLPDLSSNGRWHIHEWNGAYLPISEITNSASKDKQVEIVNAFLISAIDACLFLLDSTELLSRK